MSEFKPGDMVECVDASQSYHLVRWIPLVKRRTYIVRGGGVSHLYPFQGQKIVYLADHANDLGDGLGDIGYRTSRFRLIKPTATDIQIFRDIVREVFEGANA